MLGPPTHLPGSHHWLLCWYKWEVLRKTTMHYFYVSAYPHIIYGNTLIYIQKFINLFAIVIVLWFFLVEMILCGQPVESWIFTMLNAAVQQHIFYATVYNGLVEGRWSVKCITNSCNILRLHPDTIPDQYSIRRLF